MTSQLDAELKQMKKENISVVQASTQREGWYSFLPLVLSFCFHFFRQWNLGPDYYSLLLPTKHLIF